MEYQLTEDITVSLGLTKPVSEEVFAKSYLVYCTNNICIQFLNEVEIEIQIRL